jgi:hypothetical protein
MIFRNRLAEQLQTIDDNATRGERKEVNLWLIEINMLKNTAKSLESVFTFGTTEAAT